MSQYVPLQIVEPLNMKGTRVIRGSRLRAASWGRGPRRLRRLYEILEARTMLHGHALEDPAESVLVAEFHDPTLQHVVIDGVTYELYADLPLPPAPAASTDGSSLGSRAVHPLSSLPALDSNLGASVSLFLDFDGHFQSNWGTYSNINTPAFDNDGDASTFSDAELALIEEIWQRVAEDFAPFHVNVTTVQPPSFADGVALRAAIGGSSADWYEAQSGTPAGGVAYVNSFTNPLANVVYAFNSTGAASEIISHEFGHALGLSHQSTFLPDGRPLEEYNPGGDGWAPLMGISYYEPVTTWHNGPTTSDTTFQLDMDVLARPANGFGFRADDHSGSTVGATPLSVNGSLVSGTGIIETTTDVDVFSFTTLGGGASLQVEPAAVGPNLDVVLTLRNASGQVVAMADPSSTLSASMTTVLSPGNYFLEVKGIGTYGYTGQYTVSGDLAIAANAEIHGTVWNDLNADGQLHANEPRLSGWEVFLDGNGNQEHDDGETATLTNSSGAYSFTNLVQGSYEVVVARPSGWSGTAPLGQVRSVTLATGQTATNENFGNLLSSPGQLSGLVWDDLNANGLQAFPESPLPDWEVYLDLNRNGQLEQAIASLSSQQVVPLLFSQPVTSTINVGGPSLPLVDVNVTVNFTHPFVGDLDVYLISPLGTRVELFTDVGAGSQNIVNLTLDDEALASITSASQPIANATHRPEGMLSDFDGELPAGAWRLEITDDTSGEEGQLDSWELELIFGEPSTRSDAAGLYTLAVEPGDYRVQRVIPSPWQATWPTSPHGGHEITVAAGQSLAGLNFGNRLEPIAIQAIDDTFALVEDAPQTLIDVLNNDSGNGLSITGFSTPASGTLTNEGTHFHFTPAEHFFGELTFTYSISDSGLNTAQANVTITVTGTNDPPQANDDTINAGSELLTTIHPLANDAISPDAGETLSIQSLGPGSAGGTLSHNGTSIEYRSAPGFLGIETFSYTINDGTPGSSSSATVTVHVAPDPAPVLSIGQHGGRPLDTVTIPVMLNNSAGVQQAEFVISYDTTLLDVELADLQLGSLTAAFILDATVDDPAGTITVTLSGAQPLSMDTGSLLEIDFHIKEDAPLETSSLIAFTSVSLNESNLAATFVDGSLEILTPALQVVEMSVDASTIYWTLSHSLDPTLLNLYRGASSAAAADVLVTEQNLGSIAGSLLWDEGLQRLAFVKTGGPLLPGDYTVTLFSRADGIADTYGEMLDGDGNGIGGDDYVSNFNIAATTARVVSIPDFARGPGQGVNLVTPLSGIPLTIDNADGVQHVQLSLRFDPDQLQITAADVGAQLPGSWQIDTFDTSTAGLLVLELSGEALAGSQTLVHLTANVPLDADLASFHLLQFESLTLNAGAISSVGDSAAAAVAFVGDTSGSGSYSALDAAYVSRVNFDFDTGFDGFPLIDPVIVADVTGDGALTATDADWIARKSVGLQQDEIPELPPGSEIPAAPASRSTTLSIDDVLGVAGTNPTVPILIGDAEGLIAFDLTLTFDPALLEVLELLTGSVTGGFNLVSNVDQEAGTISVAMFRRIPAPAVSGSVLEIHFDIPDDTNGAALLDFAGSLNEGQIEALNTPGSIYVGGWQNPNNPSDVDDNGVVEVVDAVIVINQLLQIGPRQLSVPVQVGVPPFLDVDGSGYFDVVDAVIVINALLSANPSAPVGSAPVPEPPEPHAVTDSLFAELGEDMTPELAPIKPTTTKPTIVEPSTEEPAPVAEGEPSASVRHQPVPASVEATNPHDWDDLRWAASAGFFTDVPARREPDRFGKVRPTR